MDDATASRPTTRYTSGSYALSGKIMLSAIVILFTVVLLILCLHIYARCFLSRRRIRRRNHHSNRRPRIIFAADLYSPTNASARGLDSALLASLPTFPFSSPTPLDCAVCLSEFAPAEKARLLPKCGHTFHADCIDMWFHSHDTCPLCRLPVTPHLGQTQDPHHHHHHVVEIAADSAEPPSESDSCPDGGRRRGVGMTIEVPPRRGESLSFKGGDEETGSQGLRTPGGRILSFKRILGMSTTTTPVSCRSGCAEAAVVEDEEGRERQCSGSSNQGGVRA